jgi:curved DNA-binding protein CbpA
MKDYYEILGLEEDASQEEIRERWLELTKIYHPDVLKSPEADERIKEINEAYQVLKDYSSRLEYDLQRAMQKSVLKKIVEKEEKKIPWPKIVLPTGVLIALALMIFYVFFKVPAKQE